MSKSKSLPLRVGALVGLAVVASLAFGGTARAARKTGPPTAFRFGLFGLGQGQVARVSVANLSDGELVPAVCHASVGFVDEGNGELLPAVQKALKPGESFFVEISFDDVARLAQAGPGGGPHLGARPVVEGFCDGSVRTPRFLVPAVDIYDGETGHSNVFFTGGILPAVQR